MKIKILSIIGISLLFVLVIVAPLQALGPTQADPVRRPDDGSTYLPEDVFPPAEEPDHPAPMVGDLEIGEVRGKEIDIPINLPLFDGLPIDPSSVIVSDKSGDLASLFTVSTGVGNQPALESSFDLGNGINASLSYDILGDIFSWSISFGD